MALRVACYFTSPRSHGISRSSLYKSIRLARCQVGIQQEEKKKKNVRRECNDVIPTLQVLSVGRGTERTTEESDSICKQKTLQMNLCPVCGVVKYYYHLRNCKCNLRSSMPASINDP
ncbi:hypothetical protein B296_00013085 [Ensete ventricosum]|uniref:Uncharacterized protein n=1 Tax=Ensete ventricosum TaxID=4639 RepID=A0A427AKW1_ENSVE|nr:hypothetical protein B296_00013085 [Ensete ventricosum]